MPRSSLRAIRSSKDANSSSWMLQPVPHRLCTIQHGGFIASQAAPGVHEARHNNCDYRQQQHINYQISDRSKSQEAAHMRSHLPAPPCQSDPQSACRRCRCGCGHCVPAGSKLTGGFTGRMPGKTNLHTQRVIQRSCIEAGACESWCMSVLWRVICNVPASRPR